jgi:hypothetical protein
MSQSKSESTPRPDQMHQLLVRLLNGGIPGCWRDAIVRVLDGGDAPAVIPEDWEAVRWHRKDMERMITWNGGHKL